jgi:hypothetical protein
MTDLKKSHLFVEFPYVCISNLKYTEHRKYFLYLSYSFTCLIFSPFNSAAQSGHTSRPSLAATLVFAHV